MTYDAESARCSVFVYREGLLASVGHDLTLEVRELSIDVDGEARTVRARFDARSLRVVGSVLGPPDQRTVEKHIRRDVLETDAHPLIDFTSSAVLPLHNGFAVEGRLVLHGTERPLTFTAETEEGRVVARVRLHQPDFGIRPFSAMLGALRIKPYVDIEIEVPPFRSELEQHPATAR